MTGRFWIAFFACVVAVCVAGFLFFTLMSVAWQAWGALGATIFAMLLVLGIAWVYDRGTTRNREV